MLATGVGLPRIGASLNVIGKEPVPVAEKEEPGKLFVSVRF
jgi:hypothetical protein